MADVQAKCCNSPQRLIENHLNFKNMLKHLFKLIWNKKKENSLLIIEILISFLAIFAVFTFGVNSYRNYIKPMGIDYKNVWAINYNNSLTTRNGDSLAMFYQGLLKTIKSQPLVEDASISGGNVPFSDTHNSSNITHNGVKVDRINQFSVDENYLSTLNAKLISGRWYNKSDHNTKYSRVVVINKILKEKIFGKEDAIGQLLGDKKDEVKIKVIGVLDDIKFDGDYRVTGYGMYNKVDTGSYQWLSTIMVKVKPEANAAFESKLYKLTANALKNSNIEIEHFPNKLASYNKFVLIPLIILSIVATFLIINVALGLFGVLWYNINKRRGEIGLRRAIGATGNAVSTQLVSESLILATFSLIIGSFFAVQFPLLNVFDLPAVVYLIALGLAVIFIYILVFICSLYPGKQAAAIYPAVALHEE
jgi:putative ABC transport system permease protein